MKVVLHGIGKSLVCGRYNVTDDPALRALLDLLGIDVGTLPTRYNIAPTDMVPAIHVADGEVRLSEMRWWLVPHWSSGPSTDYAMFNARAENLEQSRAFKGPFQYRRALIPASSFIEWQKMPDGKQPWLIQPEAGAFRFGGWLNETSPGPRVRELLHPQPRKVVALPVDRRINNARHKEAPQQQGEPRLLDLGDDSGET